MKRFLLCAAVAVFFWPYWAQQAPRIYYYPRPAGQPAQTFSAPLTGGWEGDRYSCPNGRCCVGGRCGLAKPAAQKELPVPPKMAGDVPEVK